MPSSKSSVDKRDVYYRKGKSDGYRARSAYKLLHLDEEFDLFRGVSTAVDLCAAPGSWSQVLGKRLRPGTAPGENRVVSVDLQPMAPLAGITTLQADITVPSTVPLVLEPLGGRKADLVICDGAPDVTGVHDLDAYLHSQLILAALTLALTLMAPHATLIFKIFLSPLDPKASVLRSQLRAFFPGPEAGEGGPDDEWAEFDDVELEAIETENVPSAGSSSSPASGFDAFGRRGGVWVRKPRSSRKGSGEAFIVCRNFDPSSLPLPSTFTPQALEELRQVLCGTLTLESLASLGSGAANSTADAAWASTKAFVGGGDLNAGICEPAPRRSLSNLVETHRRDASLGSIGSLEDAPSPISTYTNLPRDLSPPSPTPSRSPPKDHYLTRIRTGLDLSMNVPLPLPSPLPGFDGSTREFRDLSDSPLPRGGGGFASAGLGLGTPHFASPVPPSPSARDRDGLAGTPYNDGAVSPALSSGSKTDAFFGTSMRESLPVPPRPLPDSPSGLPSATSGWVSGLGRVPSIGRGLPSSRSRVVTGPPSSSTEILATSPTSPTLIAPTPLRSVTGPAPPVLSQSPSPTPEMSSHLSPRAASRERPAVPRVRRQSNIVREAHHFEPGCRPVQVGDILIPVADDDTFPIKSSKDPGTWLIVQSLGFGAFASVWSAKPVTRSAAKLVQAGVSPVSTPDPVGVCAVKMVDRKACVRSSRNASAFYREVEVLRHLVHQGVVGYVAHFSTVSHHCLVLERLQGGELFSLVEVDANRARMLRPGPGDPEGHGLIRRIFGELCRAVSWLHEVEVVHRDIKLENILFTVNPFLLPPTSTGSVPLEDLPVPLVKLTDFGLARFIRSSSPLLQTRCGSEAYAAPEVVMGNVYDGRKTDAWALGVVLYALVAGELPFEDGAPPAYGRGRASSTTSTASVGERDEREARRRTMHRIAKGEYGWRDGVGTPAVRAVVARLLKRDPARRPRVAQLWEEAWMNTEPGNVPPPTEALRPRRGRSMNGDIEVVENGHDDYFPEIPRRASDAPHVVVAHGVLVDHECIAEVAHAETPL
ncbi:kinase-like protein [Cutaneotrichosporon oleaginosum]|uniref:Kinase-like protein n=1 Tax=Cutaneotrichosporon oleaginosum TaxID=879819 RepID=A0A0J0XR45_9TREE|nr:kinase-like protein [Cutaneotrichosporon oleaginosum]KLT43555.1 kinase-like protein [Cutaneotrichosporon oleaginosum]TXT05546.1 hypothetical protein COLE_06866 [Cutaneotrichosporon oleaginosum]